MSMNNSIVAISTPPGEGGIAIVRLSGDDAFIIADKIWKGKSIAQMDSHTVHLGKIVDTDGNEIDHAVATVFRAPNSFTGENTVEFSLHGSKWIQQQVVDLLVNVGAKPAGHGEFSQRAFLNGKLDLAQAEGIADLIAASSRAAHKLAMTQLSGSFSDKLNQLRDRLLEIGSLLELELDFSEEDVQFADRNQLISLIDNTLKYIRRLIDSYAAGRVFKEGVPVAIAGIPNAGKSTLLNALLDQEKAIVSNIPGTTRDVIEDAIEIEGVLFRFYDTAGLRKSNDIIEQIGVSRALDVIKKSTILLWIIDPTQPVEAQLEELRKIYIKRQNDAQIKAKLLVVCNKSDLIKDYSSAIVEQIRAVCEIDDKTIDMINISAKDRGGIDLLERELISIVGEDYNPDTDIIVTNARHCDALKRGAHALERARESITGGLPGDLIAQDIRESLHYIGEVTGSITTPDLLSNIFSHFCIGK